MSINWRTSGDMSLLDWSTSFPINSRLRQDGELTQVYNAVLGYSRLARGMLQAESSGVTSFGGDPASNKNAFNLRPPDNSGGFMAFPTWAAGALSWKERITSPTYKNGIYASTQTVHDLVSVYAPSSDANNVDEYVATVEAVIARYAPIPSTQEPSPMSTLNMTRDLIPLPTFQTRIITDPENDKWDNLGKRVVNGFVLHRQLGSLDGTDQYFRRGTASTGLTDWGVRATDDTIYLWNSPEGFPSPNTSANKSPWASGSFNTHGDAYGDGLAFVNKYGINAVNRDETAWEIDGNYNDPWTEPSQATAAQACAHYAHNYGITWEQFPIHPKDGFSFVRWHQEITGPIEKICPGPVVMNLTPAWIERVRAIMKYYQTGANVPVTPTKPPKTPKYAKPIKPSKVSASFLPYGANLKVIKEYQPRQYASDSAPATGPVVPVGKITQSKWLNIAEDGTAWFCTTGGSLHPAWAFFPTTTSQK